MNITQMLMGIDRVNHMPMTMERLAVALEAIEAIQKSGLLQAMITFESTRAAKVEAWGIKDKVNNAHDVSELPVKPDGTPYIFREAKTLWRNAEDNHDDATIALHDLIRKWSTDE